MIAVRPRRDEEEERVCCVMLGGGAGGGAISFVNRADFLPRLLPLPYSSSSSSSPVRPANDTTAATDPIFHKTSIVANSSIMGVAFSSSTRTTLMLFASRRRKASYLNVNVSNHMYAIMCTNARARTRLFPEEDEATQPRAPRSE